MKFKSILLACVGVCLFTACDNDDREFPDYKYSTVYFSYQTPVRTIVLGEYDYDNTLDNEHKCRIMAKAAGMYENRHDIIIDVEIDESLCDGWCFDDDGRPIKAMPRNYYNYDALKQSQIVIPAGNSIGGVNVELTDEFFKDKDAVATNYVIPMVMKNVAGADSILQGRKAVSDPHRLVADDWKTRPKDYILYGVKYVNTWDGVYLRRGKEKVTGNDDSRVIVRHAEYVERNERCSLKSKSLNDLTVSLCTHDKDNREIPFELSLSFDDNNRCSVSSPDGESYTVSGSGTYLVDGDKNSWGGEDRNALYLDYTLSLVDGSKYEVCDTLTFLTRAIKMELFTPTKK